MNMATTSVPRNDDDAIEQEIQRNGKTAPRLTPEDIEATIVGTYYFTAGDATSHCANPDDHVMMSLLTFCVLVLRNGFIVTGESACVSPENFDAGIGMKIARQKAFEKIWSLEGYLLKEKLSRSVAFGDDVV